MSVKPEIGVGEPVMYGTPVSVEMGVMPPTDDQPTIEPPMMQMQQEVPAMMQPQTPMISH